MLSSRSSLQDSDRTPVVLLKQTQYKVIQNKTCGTKVSTMVLTDVHLTADVSDTNLTPWLQLRATDSETLPTSWNYEADSDTTTDDEWLDLDDDDVDVVLSCENCGLDFWNVCCLSNGDEQQNNRKRRQKVKKVKRMKKRRDRDVIKRQLDMRNIERMRILTSQSEPLNDETTTCFRSRITLKMTSLSLFDRFVPRNDVIARLLRHQDKKPQKNRIERGSVLKRLVKGHSRKSMKSKTDHDSQSNTKGDGGKINGKDGNKTGKKGTTCDWREQCLKKLKKNNQRVTSQYKDLPGVKTCLFCFYEINSRFLLTQRKRTKKSNKKFK